MGFKVLSTINPFLITTNIVNVNKQILSKTYFWSNLHFCLVQFRKKSHPWQLKMESFSHNNVTFFTLISLRKKAAGTQIYLERQKSAREWAFLLIRQSASSCFFFLSWDNKACRGTKNHTARGRQTHHPSNFFVSNNILKSPIAAFRSNEIRVSNSNFLTCFHYWLFKIFFQEGQGIFCPGHQGQKIIFYLHGKDKKNFPTIK